MKRSSITAMFLLTVLALGCTGGGQKTTTSSGIGLAIVSYSADYSQLFPGDATLITMVIRNNGERTADNIAAQLYRYGDLNIETTEANQALGNPLQKLDEDQISWRLTAPEELRVQMTNSYSPAARVCYDYSTVVHQDMFITGSDWRGTPPALESGVTTGPFYALLEVNTPIRGARNNQPIKLNVDKIDNGIVADGVGLTVGSTSKIIEFGQTGYLHSVQILVPMLDDTCLDSNSNVADCFVIEDEDTATANIIESGDFLCDSTSTSGYYTCKLDTNTIETQLSTAAKKESYKEKLRLIGGDTGLFRLYVNTNNPGGDLQYTARVRAEFDYKFCKDTTMDFPITITVSPST